MNIAFFSKIPPDTLRRMEGYAICGFNSTRDESKELWTARIVTACSILYDCGYLSFQERITTSTYFRRWIYLGKESADA